jgi:predicted alpha-1,6-mannanase (GH76 family)
MKLHVLTLALLCSCSGSDETTDSDSDPLAADTRAHKATAALVQRFWNGGERYLDDAAPSDGKLAGYWIYAEAFDAVLDAAQRTHGQEDLAWVARLYDGQDRRGWKRDFFDDENWMALALIRAYDVTHDAKYLSRAEWLFADIDSTGRTNTGIWWSTNHTQKATASNFGPAITAARLAERTGKPTYTTAAREIYDQWFATMVDHTTHQVADHRSANGTVDWSKFTYDTGLAIGASIELWKVTGNHGYLDHAYEFGTYLITQEVAPSQFGNILHDANCTGDCHMFKGIAFRFLAKLYTLDRKQTQYYDVLKASLRAIWYDARNTSTDLFSPNWSGGPPNGTSLGAQASAVIALNIAAEDGI